MDKAGTVEQHIHRANLRRRGFHCIAVKDIELACADACESIEFGELFPIDIGCDDRCPFAAESLDGGPADTLR